ncbi:MAG: universal stress protein [Hyphomicrobium sp.]|uniref:universal stress protein n=1 Tax=Hyphomicrobium sp. TaxID=82 RepID=UPI0013230663|nr:universal stress protein [Hyphomicrobium sp.]KAB2943629.1 MAG: universal stress protein [Hyphomicrobium sp.]MBZ0208906.1 universal stress protein [Hyphomicrobium sp.]
MFRKILIANDGSEGAGRALSAAINLAKEHEAGLHMISVEEMPRFPVSVDEVVEERLDANHRYEPVIARAQAQAQAQGIKLKTHVVPGHAVPTIVDFVERHGFDMLVVGYMGHSALYNRLIAVRRTASSNMHPVMS